MITMKIIRFRFIAVQDAISYQRSAFELCGYVSSYDYKY